MRALGGSGGVGRAARLSDARRVHRQVALVYEGKLTMKVDTESQNCWCASKVSPNPSDLPTVLALREALVENGFDHKIVASFLFYCHCCLGLVEENEFIVKANSTKYMAYFYSIGLAVVGGELNGAEKQVPERAMCVLADGADAAAEFEWYRTKFEEVDCYEGDGSAIAEFYRERQFEKGDDDEQMPEEEAFVALSVKKVKAKKAAQR